MGEPFFQVKAMLQRNRVAVYSSNYTLYADMSRRVQDVLRPFASDMEVYSIDESFLHWTIDLPWAEVGREIVQTVQEWTGLPVCAGFGTSKTLAKLANKMAKTGSGVCVLGDNDNDVVEALAKIALTDIWGISTRCAK